MASLPGVVVTVPTRGWIASEVVASLINLLGSYRGDKLFSLPRNAPRDRNRNFIVKRFLDQPQYDWLLMLDDDSSWPADTIEKLIAVGQPLVCGVQPLLLSDTTCVNVCYDMPAEHKPIQWPGWWDWDKAKAPHPIAACGFGCVLMHRSALVDIGFPWFVEHFKSPLGDGYDMTEDIHFCQRAQACGIPFYVHPGVVCDHWKLLPLSQFMSMDQLQRAAEVAAEAAKEQVQ